MRHDHLRGPAWLPTFKNSRSRKRSVYPMQNAVRKTFRFLAQLNDHYVFNTIASGKINALWGKLVRDGNALNFGG